MVRIMKNTILRFEEQDVYEQAKEFFIQICGFREMKSGSEKMLALGLAARDRGVASIDIRAVVSAYDADVFRGDAVVIGDAAFDCPAFERVDRDCVEKVYAFLMTVGECASRPEDGISAQVFADMWGTAYADAALETLETYIKQEMAREFPGRLEQTLFLSDSFGPGLYGMNVSLTKELFGLMDAESVGMRVNDSGMMLPVKSCSGFYFAVTDDKDLPQLKCEDCGGNVLSCGFCRFRPERTRQER